MRFFLLQRQNRIRKSVWNKCSQMLMYAGNFFFSLPLLQRTSPSYRPRGWESNICPPPSSSSANQCVQLTPPPLLSTLRKKEAATLRGFYSGGSLYVSDCFSAVPSAVHKIEMCLSCFSKDYFKFDLDTYYYLWYLNNMDLFFCFFQIYSCLKYHHFKILSNLVYFLRGIFWLWFEKSPYGVISTLNLLNLILL